MSSFTRIFVCISSCLGAGQANAAEHQRTQVNWEAVPGCPSETDVVRQVEARLRQPIELTREQELKLDARVSRTASGEYEVILNTRSASGTGQRRIADLDCDKLADATSLMMALAIDPTRVREVIADPRERDAPGVAPTTLGSQSHPPVPPSEQASGVPPSVPLLVAGRIKLSGAVASKPRIEPASPAWRIGGNAWGGTGLLPLVDLGMSSSIGFLGVRPFEFRLGLGGFLSQSQSVAQSRGALSISERFVEPSACIQPAPQPWHSTICLGAQLGQAVADGPGLDNRRTATAATARVGLESGFGYYLTPRFALRLSMNAGFGLLRPRFGVNRDGETEQVFRSSGMSFHWGLGACFDTP